MIIEDKISYLKNIYEEENDRQKVAEGKCAQLVSNSGIFLTLIGLLITLLYNTQEAMATIFKVILIIVISCITILYLLAMWSALEGLNPLSYNYARADPNTIDQFTDAEKFKEQIVKDYLTCISTNNNLNSTKLERLAVARKAFVAGIYATGLLTFGLILYLCFFYSKGEPKPQKIEIVSPNYSVEIHKVESTLKQINNKLTKDTIFIVQKPKSSVNSKTETK